MTARSTATRMGALVVAAFLIKGLVWLALLGGAVWWAKPNRPGNRNVSATASRDDRVGEPGADGGERIEQPVLPRNTPPDARRPQQIADRSRAPLG